ncbi:hypothetical protein FS749_005528 [Ceratobasidium sp. UAMH 11750]|nr:hypothetical protein FS749_005528 [Ceratobasidium sp. UAMH 11750]
MAKYKPVELSDLKFVKPKQPRSHFDPQPNIDQQTTNQPHTGDQFLFSSSRSTPYERLAAGKPGEELAPEGAIWQMYVEEAKEHDSELVESKNKNLDVMLLFAALFSAILTAFIIESKSLLEEDSGDLTVTMLLAIAQSQQRMEQGAPQVRPPIERPSFSASISARWINGLWFTALTLSLASALVAMLAKEWLTAFTASRPRPALAHALLHQERLQGLIRWRALHLVDFLPTMLHLSLLLFFLGLAVYLWILDSGIAIAEVIIAGMTLLFYVSTALFGALNQSCPFVTQISKYLRVIFGQLASGAETPTHHPAASNISVGKEPTDRQLRALLWLIENTRDPAIGDCACQALAGMRTTRDPAAEPTSSGEPNGEKLDSNLKSHYNLLNDLYTAVQTRLTEVRLRLSQEPIENQGLHMAQYASAMPALVHLLEVYSSTRAKSPAVSAFDALDSIWTNDCPGLTPDSYAILVGADLRLIGAVAHAHHPRLPEVHTFRALAVQVLPPDLSSSQENASTETWAMIDMQTATPAGPEDQLSLFQLRARCSRTLARAGYLLSYHNRYKTPITARALAYLLESMRFTAECENLNPVSHIITCFPQLLGDDTLPGFDIDVPSEGRSHSVDPLDIGDEDGILAGLVQTISFAGVQDNPSVELLAGRALVVFGPMLLKQWVHMMAESSEENLEQYPASADIAELMRKHWPEDHGANQLDGMTDWTLNQLLVIAVIAISLADCPQMSDLSDIACAALCLRATAASGRASMFELAEDRGELLSELIRFAKVHRRKLRSDTLGLLMKLFLTEHSDRTLFRNRGMHSSGLPHLLHFLALMPEYLEPGQKLLVDLQALLLEEVDKPWLPNKYLLVFTQTAEGFAALTSITHQRGYLLSVLACIIDTVHCANQFSKLPRRAGVLFACAVPGLLEVVQFVVESIKSGITGSVVGRSFMDNVMSLLRSLDPEARGVAEACPSMAVIYQTLKDVSKTHEDFVDLVNELNGWVDVDARRLRGLDQMFMEPRQ